MKRFFWFTDTHFDTVPPWTFLKFIIDIKLENPDGIIITGDISNGFLTAFHLSILAKIVSCPIYFVMGNHDFHGSSIEKTYEKIKKLCNKYKNLIWLTDSGVVPINEEVAFIGHEGWYSATNAISHYIRFTFDWFMVEDFRKLKNMQERMAIWKQMAEKSTKDIADKLEKAIEQGFKTIYILTHFVPYPEANLTIFPKFWVPYNTNYPLGEKISKIMENHKKKHVIFAVGHSHQPVTIHISRNIECRVGPAHYFGISNFEKNIILI